jgi:hypothetical protein
MTFVSGPSSRTMTLRVWARTSTAQSKPTARHAVAELADIAVATVGEHQSGWDAGHDVALDEGERNTPLGSMHVVRDVGGPGAGAFVIPALAQVQVHIERQMQGARRGLHRYGDLTAVRLAVRAAALTLNQGRLVALLGNPVSSTIQSATGSHAVIAERTQRAAYWRTGASDHGAVPRRCSNRSWCALQSSESAHARAVMGSTLLLSLSPNSPIAQSAKDNSRWSWRRRLVPIPSK